MAKTLRIEITVEEEDGHVVIKTLDGKEAEKWSEFVSSVCLFAEVHNANPNWASLNWRKNELDKSQVS